MVIPGGTLIKEDRVCFLERNTGRVQCTKCFEDFQATINFLSEPIDVFNEWIDACEAANT